MKKKLPVLLICYLRLDQIEKAIEKLFVYGVQDIYLAIDGAKNEKDFETQSLKCKDFQKKYQQTDLRLHIWHRQRNLGIAVSVITAIDWFFSNTESGIILEDDLRFEESFIDFCEIAWEKYEKNENVWMVSGSNFMPEDDRLQVKCINYPMIWGWCSSSEKWKKMRVSYLSIPKTGIKDWFIPRNTFFLVGLIRANSLSIDTWDIQIAQRMLKEKRYCILPPVNLISNQGFDENAVHTTLEEFPLNMPMKNLDISKIIFKLPRMLHISKSNKYMERKVFRVGKRHWLSLMRLVINRKVYYRGASLLGTRLNGVKIPNE